MNVKMPHVSKDHKQEIEIWFKIKKNRPRMNYHWIGIII